VITDQRREHATTVATFVSTTDTAYIARDASSQSADGSHRRARSDRARDPAQRPSEERRRRAGGPSTVHREKEDDADGENDDYDEVAPQLVRHLVEKLTRAHFANGVPLVPKPGKRCIDTSLCSGFAPGLFEDREPLLVLLVGLPRTRRIARRGSRDLTEPHRTLGT